MKTIIIILALIVSFQVFGQMEPENELEKIYYSLPIQAEIKIIIYSAKQVESITSFGSNYYITDKPYFTGHLSKNDYISIEPNSGQIEIFRSGPYTLWGVDLDSLNVGYVSFDFAYKMTKELKREYKIFKK